MCKGLATVVKEPVEFGLFVFAVIYVKEVDGWIGACVELLIGDSL